MTTPKQKSCLSKEFRKLKKKKTMGQKQKVAIALSVCKVSKNKIGSTNESEIKKLRDKKEKLIFQFDELAKVKKKLYSNIDISKPKSIDEKELDIKLNKIASEIMNTIVLEGKLLKK